MKARVLRSWARLQRTRPVRAWSLLGQVRGNLLAAGIAYFAFFSLFPALALAAVVFGFVLRGRPELVDAIGDSLNEMLPGFVRTAANPEGILALNPPEVATLNVAGVVAAVTLVLGGLGWIGSLRDGIRTVLGVPGAPGNLVLTKLRDLAVLVLLGAALVVSTVLSSSMGGAALWLADVLGLADVGWLVTAAGVAGSFLLDVATMVLFLRLLSGVSLPWSDLRSSALIGGATLTLLKLVGAQIIARATSNPVFGSIVVVVGLLFWLNLVARVILLTTAWAAIDRAEREAIGQAGTDSEAAPAVVSDPAAAPTRARAARPAGSPVHAPADSPERVRVEHGLPDLGVRPRGARDRDRVTLAAGAVVGAGATLAGAAVVRAIGSLGGVLRPHRRG